MPASKPYPPPLTIPPLQQDQHTHTLILLHGRGSNSERFGRVFLDSTGIAQRLPTTKFIFPTARKRRSTVLKRIPINQWFDNYSLEDPNTRTELQLDGLQETSEFLRGLVEEEVRVLVTVVGLTAEDAYARIVVGGLSQGCAASMFCLLGGWLSGTEEGRRLGGFVGMSGWLPLEGEIAELLKMDDEENGRVESDSGSGEEQLNDDDDDPFAHDSDDEDVPVHIQAVNHIRDVLGMPTVSPDAEDSENPLQMSHLGTPVFLGHGTADPKVSVALGRRMAAILADGFGMDVTWKAYDEFGHWYKVPDEIDDVLLFLKEKAGLAVEESV